ncbi:MAG: fibronectin type III domain-containing protein [Bacteroidia bacterium]
MKRLINFVPALFLLLLSNLSYATIPQRTGWWKFDNPANLTKAEAGFGTDLALTGTQSAASGPETGNGAVLIGPGSYYKMSHQIAPKSPETYVNEYTIQYDFKIPQNGIWHSFFQTSETNSNDGDFFINPSGNIGVAAVGYSSFAVSPNEWYRLIISVKNGSFFSCYLDGKLLMNGTVQTIDGRFSLSDLLLIFADDDGEDGNIYCSELALWSQALTADQAKELGGFGHAVNPNLMTRIPYLQGPGQTTMNVCWHDTASTGTKVEYGLDTTLKLSTAGSSELVSDPFRWHTVKLSGLQANTRYFYRVASGTGKSGIYSFKTLPDLSYTGKLRFVMCSDTHDNDTTNSSRVLRAAKAKISQLYGSDIENHINGIFHSGDITMSGNVPEQYTSQYFRPMSALSSNIPTMVVAGNHEGESPFFYKYLKLDDQSVFPTNTALNEKIWQMRVGNSLFIGLNTNITAQYGTIMANWLDTKLIETESDTSIDFVFLFMHHPPYSELWFDVSTFDGGANYVKNVLFPVIKKYTKVQQLHSGHTHGFERGTVLSGKADGDFRFIIGGGGGGALDNWGDFTNYDYPDIHIALDQFCFQILEIDMASHSWQSSMYSLGNQFKSRNSEPMDTWYKKTLQPGPATPAIENALFNPETIQFNSSVFSGTDSLMTVEMKINERSVNSIIVLDSLANWENIYGTDQNYIPIDKNRGINLNQLKIKKSKLSVGKSYDFSVRYRDHNLKWSAWSNSVPFNTNGIISGVDALANSSDNYQLNQNYPNPFRGNTSFAYTIPEKSDVIIRIYDKNGQMVDQISEGVKSKGTYQVDYRANRLRSDMYFYQLITGKLSITKKMMKID